MTKHGGGGGAGEIRSAPRLPIILNFLARKQKQEARNNGGFPPAADERVGESEYVMTRHAIYRTSENFR